MTMMTTMMKTNTTRAIPLPGASLSEPTPNTRMKAAAAAIITTIKNDHDDNNDDSTVKTR